MKRIFLSCVLVLGAGCQNAGKELTLPATGQGLAVVSVVIDRDGSGTISAADTLYTGALIGLYVDGGVERYRLRATEENGLASFFNIPFGRYRYRVDPSFLGDSLTVQGGDDGLIIVTADPDSATLSGAVRVGYPSLTVAQARATAAGKTVVVSGVVSSALQFFSDSATFIASGGASIRITGSLHWPGRVLNNIGDSVAVSGVIGSESGQPVLLNGRILTLAELDEPTAEEISVAEVAGAGGATLDAALVHVATSEIVDTATVDNDFHVTIASGSDTALVVIDSKVVVPLDIFAPGTPAEWRGVLVPTGNGGWILRPRPVVGDIFLN